MNAAALSPIIMAGAAVLPDVTLNEEEQEAEENKKRNIY